MLSSEVGRLAQLLEGRPHQQQDHTSAVNPLAPFCETLSKATWYASYRFDRRLAGASAREEDVSRVIMGGNMKLNGRVCTCPVAGLVESAKLGLFTSMPCSKALLYRKRRCQEHDVSGPLQGEGLGDEVVVAHCRRFLLTSSSSSPYSVCLKPTDDVIGGNANNLTERWITSYQAM